MDFIINCEPFPVDFVFTKTECLLLVLSIHWKSMNLQETEERLYNPFTPTDDLKVDQIQWKSPLSVERIKAFWKPGFYWCLE